jgi:hypothetical protein
MIIEKKNIYISSILLILLIVIKNILVYYNKKLLCKDDNNKDNIVKNNKDNIVKNNKDNIVKNIKDDDNNDIVEESLSYIDKEDYNSVDKNWLNKYVDKIYIITLEKRKKYIKNIMKTMKIENYEIIDAIDKNTLNLRDLMEKNLLSNKFNLNQGRMACHLSHIKTIRNFLSQSKLETCLIFEDDIKIPVQISTIDKQINDVINNVPDDWNVINIGKCWEECNLIKIINEHVVKSFPLCRHAYILNKEGANIILYNTLPLGGFPGDEMMKQLASADILKIYAPHLSLFTQNRSKLKSELNNGDTLSVCLHGNVREKLTTIMLLKKYNKNNIKNIIDQLIKIDTIDEIILGFINEEKIPDSHTTLSFNKKETEIKVLPLYNFYKKHKNLSILKLALLSKYNNIFFIDENNLKKLKSKNLLKLISVYQNDKYNFYMMSTNDKKNVSSNKINTINLKDKIKTKISSIFKKDNNMNEEFLNFNYTITSRYMLENLLLLLKKHNINKIDDKILKIYKNKYGYYPLLLQEV